jgi:hypothetical protein
MRDEADHAATVLSDEVRLRLYDQALDLARIGAWECELETEHLTWTSGVYDIFGYPMGNPLRRASISISMSTSPGATWNSLEDKPIPRVNWPGVPTPIGELS